MEDGKSIELKNKFNKTVEDLNAIIQHPDIDAIEKYYNSFIDQSIKTVLEYLNQLESEEVSNEGNLSEKIAVIAKQALELNKKIIQFQELKENEMKGALKNIRKQTARSNRISTIIMVLSLGLGIVVAFVLSKMISGPLEKIMLAVKKIEKGDYECDIGIRSKDELGTLAKILAHMSNTIGGFIQEYKKNIEDIMNHVGQGILTISHDHKIHPQYSSVSETIFGRTIKDLELTELLYHTDKEKQSFEDWVKIVFDNNRKFPIKSLLELAEKKIIIKVSDIEKSLLIDYIPIYKKGTQEVYKIMVVLADDSHEKKMEEQHNQEMQEHEQVVKISRNQDGVFHFINDGTEKIESTKHAIGKINSKKNQIASLNGIYRELHTIKGAAAMFSLSEIVSISHASENILNTIIKDKNFVTKDIIKEIQKNLDSILSEIKNAVLKIRQLIGDSFGMGHKVIKIKEKKFIEFQNKILKMNVSDEVQIIIKHALKILNKVPLSRVLNYTAETAATVAEKLNKIISPIQITGENIEIDVSQEKSLQAALLHIIRNSLDHGIESPHLRSDMGKQEEGTVAINCSKENNQIILQIKDDGKGIDPSVIRQSAIKKGLMNEEEANGLTDQEVISLIFQPGFSSKENASEISGRGVGMDVVKTEIESLGGKVRVESEVKKGTTFTLIFPD